MGPIPGTRPEPILRVLNNNEEETAAFTLPMARPSRNWDGGLFTCRALEQ